ncbi:transglutaminase-like cysteine peptidase [Erythrobacter sp. JK5]|nr:transglutaminase-like cysteine peptidase [Erythrobacter sp. JK5]
MTCPTAPSQGIVLSQPAIAGPSLSKGAAILGGEMSALDRMRMQQSQSNEIAVIASPSLAVEPLQPAASGPRDCARPFGELAVSAAASPLDRLSNDDFLASKRVRIGRTNFDRDWRRVRSERISARPALRASAEGKATTELVSSVNRWVNRKIRYVEDRELYGRADYWAGARLTLLLGKGDCEDIALAKMQLLAAAGVPRRDMYLTIARDTVRRADHALLVVKLDDRYVVLDNTTDKLLDGRLSHDYNPVLSFNAEAAWLHGY